MKCCQKPLRTGLWRRLPAGAGAVQREGYYPNMVSQQEGPERKTVCPEPALLPSSLLLWVLPIAGRKPAQSTQQESPGRHPTGLLFFLRPREQMEDNQHKE